MADNKQSLSESCVMLTKYMLMFAAASFIGWLYEVICVCIWLGVYVDRGVLHLPFCPIYGFGMMILLGIFARVKNPAVLFFGSALITTGVELAASYILEYAFNMSLWSYEGWPFNFQNRISALSSCIFGLLALLFIKLVKPLAEKMYASDKRRVAAVSVAILYCFCLVWELYCRLGL